MTSDIAERLRWHDHPVMREAADEIERLRHKNSRLHAALSWLTTDITQSQAAMDAVSLAALENACATLEACDEPT